MNDSKKNVLIVAGVFKPEPIVSANLLYELATALSERYNVTVLRPVPTRPQGFVMPEWDSSAWPFREVILDSYTCPESKIWGRFKESFSHGSKAADYIRNNHDSIDFIYNDSWHLFGINKVARTAVKYKIPYITPVQDIYPESLISKLPDIKFIKNLIYKLLLPIDKYNLNNAVKIHTISDKMVDIIASTRNLDKRKFVVVRNWQNDKIFSDYLEQHKNATEPQNTFTFMYMGNVGRLAGLEDVIKAFKQIGISNIRLVIAGSGAARNSLMKLANDDKRIEFWDVPDGSVPATQAKASVMILPVKKGFALSSIPSKLPAYMFSAKPIIAAVDDESDTAKCVIDSDCGWVIPPEDIDCMKNQMINCISTNEEKLRLKGLRGREFALQHLSRDKNLSRLVDACIEVIEHSQQAL